MTDADQLRAIHALHGAAGDLSFIASGGACDPLTLRAHSTELQRIAAQLGRELHDKRPGL